MRFPLETQLRREATDAKTKYENKNRSTQHGGVRIPRAGTSAELQERIAELQELNLSLVDQALAWRSLARDLHQQTVDLVEPLGAALAALQQELGQQRRQSTSITSSVDDCFTIIQKAEPDKSDSCQMLLNILRDTRTAQHISDEAEGLHTFYKCQQRAAGGMAEPEAEPEVVALPHQLPPGTQPASPPASPPGSPPPELSDESTDTFLVVNAQVQLTPSLVHMMAPLLCSFCLALHTLILSYITLWVSSAPPRLSQVALIMANELGRPPLEEHVVDMVAFSLKALSTGGTDKLDEVMAMVTGLTKILVYGGGSHGAIPSILKHPFFIKCPWQVVPYASQYSKWSA